MSDPKSGPVGQWLDGLEAIAEHHEALVEQNADLRCQLAELHTKMPCGHEARFVVGSDEGTNWCALCGLESVKAHLRWRHMEETTDETD